MNTMKSFSKLCSIAFVLVALVAFGAPHVSALEVGSPAPRFLSIDQNGELWNIEEHLGEKNIVFYFYPAAMTGGCTKQACAYRDNLETLASKDTIVVGVSGDAPAGLKVFEQSHDLNFTLLADFDGKIAKLFDVPLRDGGVIERLFNDATIELKRGVTSSRWTFVVGKNQEIVYVDQQVQAAQDSAAVLEFLGTLD